MVSSIIIALTFTAVIFGLASGKSQHLVCKTIESVFEGRDYSPNERNRTLQGPAGKKGPPGVKGDIGLPGVKGEKGMQGIVDYQAVSDSVEEKLNRAAHCQYDDGGFLYFGKCYFLIHSTSRSFTFAIGQTKCADSGGEPANVLNLKHQILIQNYMRSLQSRSNFYVWLGMTYDPQEKALKFSSGDRASSYKWYPGYPNYNVGVGIESKSDKSSADQGIFTFPTSTSTSTYGVLCEK